MFVAIRAELQRLEALVWIALGRATGNPAWITQSVWHIDFDNGSDTADGLEHATAIKTFREFMRRVGDDYAPPQDVDIYCYGDNRQDDPLSIKRWYIATPRPGHVLRRVRIHGPTPVVYYSGVFSAVQARNPATNTPFVVTDLANIGANQTPPVPPPNDQVRWWDPIVDPFGAHRGVSHDFQRLRIVGGPRDGALSWTSDGNGVANARPWAINGNMRTMNWVAPVPYGYDAGFLNFGVGYIIPQAGDHYVMERMGKLYLEHANVEGNDDFGGSGVCVTDFLIELLNGYDSQDAWSQPMLRANGGGLTFVNCMFDSVATLDAPGPASFCFLSNTVAVDTIVFSGLYNYMEAGGCHLGIGIIAGGGGAAYIDGGAMVETGALMAAGANNYLFIGDACAFDQPGHSVKAGAIAWDGGTIAFMGTSAYVNAFWGTDDDAQTRKYGVATFDGGRFFVDPAYKTGLTINGHQSDFNIGESERDGNKARSIDPATGLPTALIPCSWLNLFATQIAGGFGVRVCDPETLATIGQQTSKS